MTVARKATRASARPPTPDDGARANQLPCAAWDEPFERQNLNAIRCGRLDPGAEEGSTARGDATEHRRGRGPNDVARRVQPLDREKHLRGPVAGTLIVDVPAERRACRSR